MVDSVVIKDWLSNTNLRSVPVHISLQLPEFGNLGLLVGLEAARPPDWWVLGAEPPRKKGKLHFAQECRLIPGLGWQPRLRPRAWLGLGSSAKHINT